MSEPVWKHGDIKLILKDDHTWVSKDNETPSEFLVRILIDREQHGAKWSGCLLSDLNEAGMIDECDLIEALKAKGADGLCNPTYGMSCYCGIDLLVPCCRADLSGCVPAIRRGCGMEEL